METKIKDLLARLAFFAEDGMAEPPIVAIAKDADALLKEMCRGFAQQSSLCDACARANVDCPIYPQQTASCVEHRPAAQQQAVPVAMSLPFFAYDSETGFERFATEAKAKQYVQDGIDEYRSNMLQGEAWPSEIENLCWGVVLGATKEIKLGDADDGSGDYYSDYVLTDAAQPPAVADNCIPVPAEWIEGLLLGDRQHHIELRAMVAAEGCGACGDGCKGQGCRLERESPPITAEPAEWLKNSGWARVPLREQPPAVADGYVRVPIEPTEEQWGGLARDIIMAFDLGGKSPASLLANMRLRWEELPEWMRKELHDPESTAVLSKGTRAVLIYRAMLAAAPQAAAAQVPDLMAQLRTLAKQHGWNFVWAKARQIEEGTKTCHKCHNGGITHSCRCVHYDKANEQASMAEYRAAAQKGGAA